jgi:hypothetical protein
MAVDLVRGCRIGVVWIWGGEGRAAITDKLQLVFIVSVIQAGWGTNGHG